MSRIKDLLQQALNLLGQARKIYLNWEPDEYLLQEQGIDIDEYIEEHRQEIEPVLDKIAGEVDLLS